MHFCVFLAPIKTNTQPPNRINIIILNQNSNEQKLRKLTKNALKQSKELKKIKNVQIQRKKSQ